MVEANALHTQFTQKQCHIWFREYANTQGDLIEPVGMEKFCEDLGVEPENVSRRKVLVSYSILKMEMYYTVSNVYKLTGWHHRTSVHREIREITGKFKQLLGEDYTVFKRPCKKCALCGYLWDGSSVFLTREVLLTKYLYSYQIFKLCTFTITSTFNRSRLWCCLWHIH